jgi:hypothetical protein
MVLDAEVAPDAVCHHAYGPLVVAAGVNAKALSAYMGHSSITVTLDR